VTGEVLEYSGYFEETLTVDEARVRFAEAEKDVDVRLDDLAEVNLTTRVYAIVAKSVCESPLCE
jgi:hypothetical protein